jgi:hypothetical protein
MLNKLVVVVVAAASMATLTTSFALLVLTATAAPLFFSGELGCRCVEFGELALRVLVGGARGLDALQPSAIAILDALVATRVAPFAVDKVGAPNFGVIAYQHVFRPL